MEIAKVSVWYFSQPSLSHGNIHVLINFSTCYEMFTTSTQNLKNNNKFYENKQTKSTKHLNKHVLETDSQIIHQRTIIYKTMQNIPKLSSSNVFYVYKRKLCLAIIVVL